MEDIIIQAIGIVAMILTIGCYQFKKRAHILLAQYIGNALWCVHYFFLGAFTALIMNALNVFRGIIYSIDKKWAKHYAWAFGFAILSTVMGILTFDKWFSILPIIGTVIATFALKISHENTLRKVYIISVPPWICYNLLANSYPGAFSSAFTLVSLVVAIFRYREKNNKVKLQEEVFENSEKQVQENNQTQTTTSTQEVQELEDIKN